MKIKIQEERLYRDIPNGKVHFPLASEDDQKVFGNRSKLGGDPDWLQQPEKPLCRHCGTEMTFYAQVDSISELYSIEDCGMIYIFYCFSCGEVYAFTQSY